MRRNPDRDILFYLALATASSPENEALSLVTRLEPPQEWREIILSSRGTAGMSSILRNENLSPSEVVAVLGEFPLPLLEAQRALTGSTNPKVEARSIPGYPSPCQAGDTGADLLGAGVPQGPEIGIMLDEVLRARMDGRVKTKEEELAFCRPANVVSGTPPS